MRPVVSIVGKAGAGKTILIERLVTEFKQRGYRIATVKHSQHNVEIDQPGKDSYRFAQVGSDAVVISSPNKLAFIKGVDHNPGLEEVLSLIGDDFDLVLTEGFRHEEVPKIEVHRRELGGELLCPPEELWAIASDEPLDLNVNQLPLNDTREIADFIERNVPFIWEEGTSLSVNGNSIFINPFVQEIIARTTLAITSTLKGVGEIRSLDISVRKKP